MNLVFERSFLKDVKAISDATVKKNIEEILTDLREAQTIRGVKSVKKMKGHKDAYRIRIGNYRIGLFAEGEDATLVRVLPRDKIYDYFP